MNIKNAVDPIYARFAQLDGERQSYILQTLAVHLSDAGRKQRLYALIDKPWLDLKQQHTGSYRSFAQDVELALQAAGTEQPPNVVQEVRCSLIQATLGSLATNSPPDALAVLAYEGHAELARGLASLMQDRTRQVEAYLGIAEAVGARKRRAAAQSALNDAAALAYSIEDDSIRSELLAEVSRALARHGSWAQARTVAESLENDWQVASSLAHVAQVMAEVGQRQLASEVAGKALEAAQAVPPRSSQVPSPEVTTMVDEPDPAQEFAPARVDALGDAAVALAMTGQVKLACTVVEGIQAGQYDPAEFIQWRKARALAELASVSAHCNQPELAVKCADLAQRLATRLESGRGILEGDPSPVALYRGSAMAAVSRAYAEAGQGKRAQEAAKRALQELQAFGSMVFEFKSGTLRQVIVGSTALQQALVVLAETGEYALAQLATDWIGDIWVYLESLMDLADVLLAAGQEELTREILSKCELELMEVATRAGSVRRRRERVDVLNRVALLWKRRGKLDRARTVIEEALTQAKRITPRSDRAAAMSELAQTLVRCGAGERALEVANQAIALTETVGDQPARIAALASLALALADAGRFDGSQCVAREALAQAGRLTGKQDQVKALSDAASALAAAKAGHEAAAAGQQAADLGRSLRQPAIRAKALAEAGRALAAAGLTTGAIDAAKDARQAIPGIRRKGTRSHILSRLAIVWAAAGSVSNAKKVATEALDVAKHTLREQKVDVLCLASEAMRQARDDRKARSRAEKALALAQAIQEPVTQADALSKAGWALLCVGDVDQALEAIQRVLASRDALASASLGPVALSRASRTLAAAGRLEQALIVWREALQWAREAGRTPVYAVLENGANMLASLDQGETGWRAFEAVMAVESWWE